LRQKLVYAAYAAASWLATGLPESVGKRLFVTGGRVAHSLLAGRRAVVAGNLARVIGSEPGSEPVRAAVREAFDLYARYWYDTFRIRVMPDREFLARCTFENAEGFDEDFAQGTGVIVALPHMGNWDAAGHWVAISGYRIVTVAEALEPRSLMELFLEHREELGMRVLTLTSDGHVGTRLAEHLKGPWVIALVADRDLTGRGIEVEMFGAKRRLPAGPALLSVRTGAPIRVATCTTTDRGWKIVIGPRVRAERSGDTKKDVLALTRVLAAEFERTIASRPTDWHIFQPAWE
jgi:KDO2-lipid IV(A) lauroyltransferase